MRMAYGRWLVVAALAASTAAWTGCANDQETINRVQPNALAKSALTGEWYMRSTVIDTAVDAPVFVGNQLGFDRVVWEIQEDVLIARRDYSLVRGIEEESVTDSQAENSVLAVFAIDSHFDIRREYNPATGEETNVVGENTVDRPWYEREYMRVDWSQNLFDGNQVPNPLSPIILKPVALFNQDTPENEKKDLVPYFESDGEGGVQYFDIVNRYWAEPSKIMLDIDGNGTEEPVDACLLIVNSYQDCNPGTIAVRASFAKIGDTDFEPFEYTQDRMARFGYFLSKRDGYDDKYGITVADRHVFTNRHNLWEQSHLRDGEGKLLLCDGSDLKAESIELGLRKSGKLADLDKTLKAQGLERSTCMAANVASHCDAAFARAWEQSQGACTMPYADRTVKPVKYYVTTNMPESLMPDALEVGKQWNRAFSETVASLRRLECEQFGGKDCAKFTPAQAGNVFVVCHNPVTAADDKACGEVGFSARYGDVRRSFLAWIDDPQGKYSGAPLGFGPPSADPITGEIISGTANLYGDAFEQYATWGADILALMRGDLTIDDVQSNAAFAAWAQSKEARAERESVSEREADRHVIKLDALDMAEANSDMDFSWAMNRLPHYDNASPAYIKQTASTHWKAIGSMHEQLHIGREGQGKLEQLQGTYIEDMLVNDEYNSMAGLMPFQALTDTHVRQLSPFSSGGSFGLRKRLQAQKALARTHANELGCVVSASDFDDDGLVGMLHEIEKKVAQGGTVDWYGQKYEVTKKVGGRTVVDYDAVREMLMHPLFFGLGAHEVGHSIGLRHNFTGSYDAVNYDARYWKLRNDGKIASRASDPMTDAEANGRIREYQYSTVMDYGHNFLLSDAHGIGHYDVAAIKMGYGDLAEVFTATPEANAQTIAELDAQASPFMVFQVDPRQAGSLGAFHYTMWPALVGGNVDNMQKRKDVRYAELSFVASPFFGDGGYSLYTGKDGKVLPAVPYLYCSDETVNSRPTCNHYDVGADAYESMQSIIDNYWDYYPFSNFMRQRLTWDPSTVPARTYGRYFNKLASAVHVYALYRQFLEPYLGAQFFEDPNGFGLYTLGVRATYDMLRMVLATPEPGERLGLEELVDGTKITSSDPSTGLFDNAPIKVDTFNGRALRSNFDIGPSGDWYFFTSSGWFKEKQLALEALLYADTGFLGTDTSPDVREYSSSFFTIFPDSASELLRAVYSGDVVAYAPRYDAGNWVYPTPADILKRGTGMKGQVVSPNVGFTLQLAAMAYGMTLIPNTFDQDFVNRSRVFVAGSSEAVELDPLKQVSFVDERSGMTYYAGSYLRDDVKGMEGTVLETGPGAAMINHAKSLQARIDAAVTAGEPEAAAAWRAKLHDYLDNLDILRYLGHGLGHGSNGGFFANQ
jgi:hypothetical protein